MKTETKKTPAEDRRDREVAEAASTKAVEDHFARLLEALASDPDKFAGVADHVRAWKALETDTTKTWVTKTCEALRFSEAHKRNAKAFGCGFADALSPSFYLWLDDDDNETAYTYRRASLRDIWDQVGRHIDEAAGVVLAYKYGRRAEGR